MNYGDGDISPLDVSLEELTLDCLSLEDSSLLGVNLSREDMSEASGTTPTDDIDDLQARMRPRRSVSARSSLKSPTSPKRKKFVRFADSLGLDLAQIRQIKDAGVPPLVPIHVLMAVREASKLRQSEVQRSAAVSRFILPCFRLENVSVVDLGKLQQQKVVLESCSVTDFTISCVIRVVNLGYEKTVVAHYTADKWQSAYDIQANYIVGGSDGYSDRFSLSLFFPDLPIGGTVEFAIRYNCQGEEFWDNFNGRNYTFECYGKKPAETGHSVSDANLMAFY